LSQITLPDKAQKFIGGLLLCDKAQYLALKEELEKAVAHGSAPQGEEGTQCH
jgi:hypothetical protein